MLNSIHAPRSIRMKTLALLGIAVLQGYASLAFAQADDRCAQQYRAEASRIEREHSQKRPTPGSKEAEVNWSKGLRAALALAAKNAEASTSAAGKAKASSNERAELDCAAQANSAFDGPLRRYGNRTLTSGEQASRKAEELKILDNRNACLSTVRGK